jgi:hypothetical protein
MRFHLVLLCSFCSLLACKTEKKTNARQDGHARMIAILDSIFRNENPEKCYNLNSRMAALNQERAAMARNPQEKLIMTFRVAEQLMYAGRTEESLQLLEQITGGNFAAMNAENRTIFDLYALGFLRLGEQQNCVQNHTSASCIVPIAKEGQHQLTDGSTKAIECFNKILEKFPDDSQTKWLLNVAYMTLGKYPGGVPAKWRMSPAVFQQKSGPVFKDIAVELGLDVRSVSGGVCMEDFDNDGDLDLFITAYLLNDQCRYFRNNGDGSFSQQTTEANLKGIVSGLNTTHADYDNDGDRDIFILRGGWLDGGLHPNSLLRNNGNGTFTDVTIEAGMLSFHPTQTCAWADYNADGYLDVFIGNESSKTKGNHPCELFINQGDGTFKEEAKSAGLDVTGFFKAVAAGDINNDRLPDLYLSDFNNENLLFLNRTTAPNNVVMTDITRNAGVGKPINSFPAFFFDFDNDGWQDLFVSGYDPRMLEEVGGLVWDEYQGRGRTGDYIRLYHNKGNLQFKDVTQNMGVNKVMFGMGNNFGDLDNDGWLDFYIGTGTPDFRSIVPNRMFRNKGGTSFEEFTMNGFGNIQKGHGIAFGDIDRDGDQDIYTVLGGAYEGDLANNVLFQNPGTTNKWITLQLIGRKCTRDAFGARVVATVRTAGGKVRKIYQAVGTGGSFGSSSLQVEMGLGDAIAIQSVEVLWPQPGRASQIWTGLSLNQTYQLEEGNASPILVNQTSIPMGGNASPTPSHHHH